MRPNKQVNGNHDREQVNDAVAVGAVVKVEFHSTGPAALALALASARAP